MTNEITTEQLDALWEAVDRLENLIAALSLPLPAGVHVESLRPLLPGVAADLRKAIPGDPP